MKLSVRDDICARKIECRGWLKRVHIPLGRREGEGESQLNALLVGSEIGDVCRGDVEKCHKIYINIIF